MRRPWIVFVALGGLGALLPACNIVGAIAFFTAPRQIQKTEFALTKGRLAVLIELARPDEDNPVFTQALHTKLTEIFREKKVNEQVVPFAEVQRLRQVSPDFDRWDMQRVAKALNAEQLLYIRVEHLSMKSTAAHPVLEPTADLRIKVISPAVPPKQARVWPKSEEREGRPIQRGRPMREASDPGTLDTEADKLGKDVARLVAKPFYDVDLEEKDQWEP